MSVVGRVVVWGGGERVILLFIAKHLISVEGIRRVLFVNSRRMRPSKGGEGRSLRQIYVH